MNTKQNLDIETLLENKKPQLSLVSKIPDKIVDGKDELNFAEFPLSAISERIDPSIKTLTFEDQIFDKSKNQQISRKVVITGSDAYGLPTSTDEEVLLALIQLSKIQGFQSKRVYFKRYQLLKILGWDGCGALYQRLSLALNRWMGVTLYYKNAWRDREEAKWADESFHMLERVSIKDATVKGLSEEDSTSYFEWNEVVFRSFQKGNVKSLNYEFLKTLKSSLTQRLYRFLDKRFYHTSNLEFDLKTLGYEHIGISRNSPTGDLKRKINTAVDELENRGFLEKIPKELRYIKQGKGQWKIIFRKKHATELISESAENRSITDKLIEFGVTQKKALKLVAEFSESLIEDKLRIALWLKENNDSRVSNNPAGFLVSSIENSYTAPKEYVEAKKIEENKIVQKKVQAEKEEADKQKQEIKQREETDKKSKIENFLASLTEEQRSALIEEALKSADIGQKKMLEIGGKVGETTKQNLINKIVLELVI